MKFKHIINHNNKGGTCLCFNVIEKRDDNKKLLSRELRISFSFCSNKDNYSKKIGKEKATNNMNTGNYLSMPIKGTLRERRNKITNMMTLLAFDINNLFEGPNHGNKVH